MFCDRRLVALDLIGLQNLVEILADRLVLDVTENEAALGDLEIGRALVGHALRLVLNTNCPVIRNRLQERLKRRTIGVLGLLVDGRLAEREEIAIKNIRSPT